MKKNEIIKQVEKELVEMVDTNFIGKFNDSQNLTLLKYHIENYLKQCLPGATYIITDEGYGKYYINIYVDRP